MERTAMWAFIIFGLLMLFVGQYRRISAYNSEVEYMMHGDPLVNAINEFNEQRDASKGGGLGGLAAKGIAGKMRGSSDPLDAINSEEVEDLPEEAFSTDENGVALKKPETYKIKGLDYDSSASAKKKDAASTKTFSYYPPSVESSAQSQKPVAAAPASPQSYYPPAVTR